MVSAEIIPFPIHATRSWPVIAAEYARRRDKAGYAKQVMKGNIERLERLGVTPQWIASEIASLERLFSSNPGHGESSVA